MGISHKKPKRSVSRDATESRLLDALETVLIRNGIRDLSVNAVVQEAGVGKPLLYRYFGDLAGLVRQWARRRGFISEQQATAPAKESSTANDQQFLNGVAEGLIAAAEFMRSNPVALELLAEELTAQSELSAAFGEARRLQSTPFVKTMLSDSRYTDPSVRGRIVVLYAAITYLAMRAARAPAFMGIRLDTDAGWQEVMDMVRSLASRR